LDNPQQQEHLGRNGRIYVEQHHHWPNVAARLETIYAEAIASSLRQPSRTLSWQ